MAALHRNVSFFSVILFFFQLCLSFPCCLPLPQEFVMGMSILAFLIILKILSKRVKKLHWIGAMGPIMACAIGIAAVAAGGLQKRGIKIVEKIPQGTLCTQC
jgi:hypothetical protein